MSLPDHAYSASLSRLSKIGPVRLQKLRAAFPTDKAIFEADEEHLLLADLEPHIVPHMLSERLTLDPEKEWGELQKHRIHILTRRETSYPTLLGQIYDPPGTLFYRGALPDSSRPHVAIVGSRHPTAYGREVAATFARELAQAGVVIVSGLAHGIDGIAHEAAVEAGGTTLAVLAGGVDLESVYPSFHRHLAEQIVGTGGALVSEFPIGSQAFKHHFPFRNRVVAGISVATLVVEAAAKSGSLITAKSALEHGREVFAVPGNIRSEMSEGPHMLLRQGAALATSPDDILAFLGTSPLLPPTPHTLPPPSDPDAKLVFEALGAEPLYADEIAWTTMLDAGRVNSALGLLELEERVKNVGGRRYIKLS